MTLHLLRGLPPDIDGEPVDLDAFERLVRRWAATPGTVFGSWTRNRPRRADELEGGSVYFVHKGRTVFRMPFLGLERVGDFQPEAPSRFLDHTAIVCAPEMIAVQSCPVRFLRGWRYLRDEDKPRDVPYCLRGVEPIDLPPKLRADMKRDGLL